jgi:SAM-dependent methyltransferase
MNAEGLAFNSETFDLVAISNSLHHLVNVEIVLTEMYRVLKEGGRLVVKEPHRDTVSESQLTSVYLHHWIADIDVALGFTHNHTFTRESIIAKLSKIGLKSISIHDRVIKEKDAFSPQTIRRYEKYYIDKFLQRARKAPDHDDLILRGELLRKRLREVGTQTQEPLVLIVGGK